MARRLIEARGAMSRAETAKALGCPLETLGNYERGRTFPDQAMLGRLKAVLGVSLDWLLTGEGGGQAAASAPSLPLDEVFFAQIADGIVTALAGRGQAVDALAVAVMAASWYNDLVASCSSAEERVVGLRVMLRRLSRQHGYSREP